MKSNRNKDHPEKWVVERVNFWHYRSRKLFTRYEKKIKKLSWNDSVLISLNLTQKDNFGRGSKQNYSFWFFDCEYGPLIFVPTSGN